MISQLHGANNKIANESVKQCFMRITWNIHFFMTIRSRFSERYHGANSCLIRKILYFYDNLVQVIRFILYAGRLKHYRQFLFYFKENPKYIRRHDATFWTSVFVRLCCIDINALPLTQSGVCRCSKNINVILHKCVSWACRFRAVTGLCLFPPSFHLFRIKHPPPLHLKVVIKS